MRDVSCGDAVEVLGGEESIAEKTDMTTNQRASLSLAYAQHCPV